ncbi:unnamed protein product [Polarella glacialis]|uniref:Cation/H+ exchanger transmembrane domain-containing protein n=1 Tax=Polarella glacialis TaxID=89957 RepID=A0A813EZ74_POLGL|nr:unnamed protein product [Polarella glacialis]
MPYTMAGIPKRALEPIRRTVLLALAFSSLYLVLGEDGAPGGPFFALLLIYVLSLAAGTVTSLVVKQLPPLLGMLIVGFALRNLPYIGARVGAQVDKSWSSAVRTLALVLILCRAGLAIDVEALRRLRFVVARLAVLPCLAEAALVGGLGAWLLDFPLAWAAMLGFLVAAISPAVVVPSLLSLQEQGYGASTGIPTMVVCAAPLDDVLAIAGFGISLGLAGMGGSERQQSGSVDWLVYARAPLELILGVSAGGLAGLILVLLTPKPSILKAEAADKDAQAEMTVDARAGRDQRLLLLLGLATTLAFGLKLAGFSGASALSILILAAGARRGWGPDATKAVSVVASECWTRLAQPLLFGLVGASVSVHSLDSTLVGLGLLLLLCGGAIRASAVALALAGTGLSGQEKLFTAVAWMPKATVQAALGGIALDEALTDREKEMGRQILAVAVLAILFTAPLGATLISVLGPRLLKREGSEPGAASGQVEASETRSLDAAAPVEAQRLGASSARNQEDLES